MELSQGRIIQKPKMQELSSLFMTHRLNVRHAAIKIHEYIHTVKDLRPGHGLLYGTKSRADNSKTKNTRVVCFVHDIVSV